MLIWIQNVCLLLWRLQCDDATEVTATFTAGIKKHIFLPPQPRFTVFTKLYVHVVKNANHPTNSAHWDNQESYLHLAHSGPTKDACRPAQDPITYGNPEKSQGGGMPQRTGKSNLLTPNKVSSNEDERWGVSPLKWNVNISCLFLLRGHKPVFLLLL